MGRIRECKPSFETMGRLNIHICASCETGGYWDTGRGASNQKHTGNPMSRPPAIWDVVFLPHIFLKSCNSRFLLSGREPNNAPFLPRFFYKSYVPRMQQEFISLHISSSVTDGPGGTRMLPVRTLCPSANNNVSMIPCF
jgi:hypothetical protein